MAKQTFTTGSVLTATQMNNLQANDYNWTVSQKTASYVLVAADAGTRIEMNSGSATTVTVNTGLFAAGDTLIIQNIGTGVCTVTAGTATVNKATAASLALSQYQAGILYFVSASSAIFYPYDIGSATGGTGYTLLTSAALTGATTITANFTAAKNLLVYVGAGSSANASATFTMRFNSDSGANYSWAGNFSRGGSTYVSTNFRGQESQYSSGTSITLGVADTGTSCQITGALRLDYGDQTGWKAFTWTGGVDPSGGTGQELYNVQGFYEASAAITSVSIISSTGNFDNGTLYVLGAN